MSGSGSCVVGIGPSTLARAGRGQRNRTGRRASARGRPGCCSGFELNPSLVYCSISGNGDTGPCHDRRVYDPIIQSLTGHAAVQLNPQFPMRDLVRNVVADKSSAYTAAGAITAALFARERGAGGQHIRVPNEAGAAASLFGEHPDEILDEFGYDAETRARMREAGVV